MSKDVVIDGSKLDDHMRYRVAMMLTDEVGQAYENADEVKKIATDDGGAMTEAEQRYVTECITYANILQKTIDELAGEDWNKHTYYLCNGRVPECKGKCHCYYCYHKKTLYLCKEKVPECKGKCHYCRHTKNPEYAINEPCPDPENHPERFEYRPYKLGTFVVHQYWEKEVKE